MEENKKLIISFFSGCGGLDLGFESREDYHVALAIDVNPHIMQIYKENFPNTTVWVKNILLINKQEILDFINLNYPGQKIYGVIGGSPCQGFSSQGKQDINDPRSQLLEVYLKLASELNPEFIILENVPAIKLEKFEILRKKAFNCIDFNVYNSHKWDLQAFNFGVPQNRNRIFWIFKKKGSGNIYPPVSTAQKKYCVFDALASLDSITESHSKSDDYINHLSKIFSTNKTHLEITGISSMVHTDKVVLKFKEVSAIKAKHNWLYRLNKYGFATTILTTKGSLPIHYRDDRRISVREAARLQSFPDWFKFHHNTGIAYTSIGNAVPPLLSRAIADAISNGEKTKSNIQLSLHLEEI